METANTKLRCYLYAIAEAGLELPSGLAGLDTDPVMAIACGEVVAVASMTERMQVRPERAHLKAHNDVLNLLMQSATVLPFSFGTIARNAGEVRECIAVRSDAVSGELARLRGMVEMGVRARIAGTDIYRYLADSDHDLRAMRDAVYGDGTPGRDALIALGMKVEQALDGMREAHLSQVLPLLEPLCAEIHRNSPRYNTEVMNLACLVHRDRQGLFEAVLAEAVRTIDDRLSFELNGPWAPHHFCDVDIRFGGSDAADR